MALMAQNLAKPPHLSPRKARGLTLVPKAWHKLGPFFPSVLISYYSPPPFQPHWPSFCFSDSSQHTLIIGVFAPAIPFV